MRTLRFTGILLGIILAASLINKSSAQDSESGSTDEPLKIQRVKGPVELDGLSDEAAWDDIKSLPIFMKMPHFGKEPSEKTEIVLGYDDDYLYAAGRFYDRDPEKIQATSLKRDGNNEDVKNDKMCIIIDAFNDNENAVMFITSPAGERTDVNILNDAKGAPDKNINVHWNTYWDVATVQNDEGWFAEMRIPFSSLRFEEKDGQTIMGLTAFRWIPHKFEGDYFPLIPETYTSYEARKPSQAHDILFEDIKPHKPLYITPYLLGGLSQTYGLNETETAYERDDDFAREIGLDVKYGLTNKLTLDVTINTDFAQVEADEQMVNLTRFSLFFPEKRLFFQERQGNFDFRFEDNIGGFTDDDNRLFHSRRIGIHQGELVRIYGGARIVGRVGPWDIGFLNMQTEKFEDLLSENFNVMRLRKQVINENSYVGGMLTSRIGNRDNWNTAYGIDGIFRLFRDDYLTIKWAQSFENDKENRIAALEPSKIYVNWNRRGQEGLGYNLTYSRSGNAFNPGVGYERRTNYTRFGDRIQFGWLPGEESKLYNHIVFIEGITVISNTDGKIESSETGLGWYLITKGGAGGEIKVKQYIENLPYLLPFSDSVYVPVGRYIYHGIESRFSSPAGKKYGIKGNLLAGSFYDGRRFIITLMPWAFTSKHLQLDGIYQLNKLDFPDRNQKFKAHIGQLMITASFNSKLSLVSMVQYNSATDKIRTNIRFRYNPREGNDFYIVYDEGLNTDRHREIPVLPQTNIRTLLLKYSYTFITGG